MDMDNDGLKDLFVSNGVLKDINNQDILSGPESGRYFQTQKTNTARNCFHAHLLRIMPFATTEI